jgi:hypothetical protein
METLVAPAAKAGDHIAAASAASSAAVTVTRALLPAPNGGTIAVSPTIYREWVSLDQAKTATGESVQASLGWPLQAFTARGAEVVYFEHGLIVQRPDGRAYAVYGTIALHYRDLYDLQTGKGLATGLPTSEEEAIPGGRRQHFDNVDIYWNAATNAAFEIQGAIREKWLALGGTGGFLGYPLSDEQQVLAGGREVGRASRFTGGSIFWSPQTGAYSVHGGILDAYVHSYNGPIGPLGFPTSDETGSPRGLKRFSNFQHGCIVWTAADGRIDTYQGLDIFVQSMNGSGSHTVFESIGLAHVWLYANATITSNTKINEHIHLPQKGGDYGQPSATPGVISTIAPMRGDMSLTVTLDGWDHNVSTSDTHLGTVRVTLGVDDDFGVNVPKQLNDGDFHALLDMRRRSVDNPNDPNFRHVEFWGFKNKGTPVLTREQYGQTFSDVESQESSAHWFDDLYYDTFKGIAVGGNCFGMCLESCFAERNDSLFSEPIFPVSLPTAMPEINVKQAYQLGAPFIDWYAANILALRFWDPIAVFEAARASWQSGDLPLICLTSENLSGGHCVRPCGPNAFQDQGSHYVIHVANPNDPGTTDTLLANQVIIDKASNTYTFSLWDGGPVWHGGKLSDGIMSWVPFSTVCRQPRTPFWEALVGVALVLLGDGASTVQMTDDQGNTLYKPGRTGTRWDDLRTGSGAIHGLARIPLHDAFLSRGPLVAPANAVLASKPGGPEIYRLAGLPSPYGPSPHVSAFTTLGGPATVLEPKAAAAAPAAAMASLVTRAVATGSARPPSRIEHTIAAPSAAPYRWGFHTHGAGVVATVSGAGSGHGGIVVERIGAPDQRTTLSAPAGGSARTAQIALRSVVPQTGATSFTVDNVTVPAGTTFAASVLSDGKSLQLENGGADAMLALHVQGPSGAASGAKTLTVPAGKTALIAAADMSAPTDLHVSIVSAPGGAVERELRI